MAEKLRTAISNFHGSTITRIQPHLVKDPDCVEMVNIEPSTGALIPLPIDTVEDVTVEKSFTKYKDEWVSTMQDAEYFKHTDKLYLTDGLQPKKTYTYEDAEYTENLGIVKPGVSDSEVSIYYGRLHDNTYIDAFFIEPFIIGLRGEDTATAGTHVDVYYFSEEGIVSRGSYEFSVAHGTKLFCHVIDGATIGIFVMGGSAIKWFKYYISDDSISAQTDITGATFLCITGAHDSANGGSWMRGTSSGSRWDSGWVFANGATQLSDGGNSWSGTSNITANDDVYVESGDVDSENEPDLKSLIANFPAMTPPEGIETFYISVGVKYKWAGGTDYRWQKINKLQLYYDGEWIGDNYGDPDIYQPRNGEYEGVIATGDWGVSGGITRDMVTSGDLGFGMNFQSGNNGRWYVDYANIRIFGLVPASEDDAEEFEFYTGTTNGMRRYKVNSSTGVSLTETWYTGKKVVGANWEDNKISLIYTETDDTAPKMALISVPSVDVDEEILLAPTSCEMGPGVAHDANNKLYVGVDKDLSDSGNAEVVCYGATGTEIKRVEIDDIIGDSFPSGMCVDNYRVYVGDDFGSYSSLWTFLTGTLEPSGKTAGVFAGDQYLYGCCKSIRRSGEYIVVALAATLSDPDENSFKGIWLYKANTESFPSVFHYSPSRARLNGSYSYGVTFYNEKDNTESEMQLFINDAYVVEGFFELINIPQPSDFQVSHIRLYRLGGALSAFSLIDELDVGTVSYQDLVTDSEAGDANGEAGRYPAPTDLHNLTEVFGTFFGISGSDLYFTTQANPNYWTSFPLELGDTGTGLGVCAQGLLVFTYTRAFFLSGTDPDTFRLYPLYGDQGCVSSKSVQKFGDGVLWISTDGLCLSNGGKPSLLSKEQLGKISFDGIRASAVYDEVYYLAHDNGVFIADFRHNNTVRFRSLSDTDIDGMGVFDDILYFHKDGTGNDAEGLYAAFTGESNRKIRWKSGKRLMTDPASVKFYKHTKLWYKGRPTITMSVDDSQVGNKLVLPAAEENTMIDIDLPHVTSGRFIQYLLEGDFELHYLEEVVDVNKR